jgi:DNA primase large subunit
VPIPVERILDFDKKEAEPKNADIGKHGFLVREGVAQDQGRKLLIAAMDFVARKERKIAELEDLERGERKAMREFEEVQTAIPEKFFPPCIQSISKGLKDGRKRAVFIMRNFLSSCGWEYDEIEDWFKKWNERHQEPLRDQYYLGQIRYAKQQKKRVLPPNCDNSAYYKSFGVCKPDQFCRYVKNPANYAIRRARYAQKDAGKGKKKVEKAETVETGGKGVSEGPDGPKQGESREGKDL